MNSHRQLKRERKPAGGGDAPATAERGINGEPTGGSLTDNLAVSVLRSQTEQRVDSCLERTRKLMMIGLSHRAAASAAKRLAHRGSGSNAADDVRRRVPFGELE